MHCVMTTLNAWEPSSLVPVGTSSEKKHLWNVSIEFLQRRQGSDILAVVKSRDVELLQVQFPIHLARSFSSELTPAGSN